MEWAKAGEGAVGGGRQISAGEGAGGLGHIESGCGGEMEF